MTATWWTTTQMPVSQDPQYSPQELYDWLANMGHFFHFLSCLLFYTSVDSLLCNSTQLFWEFKTARTKQLVNAGPWLVQIEGLASSWPMREGQPQPPLLCQYYGLRQFWKDRQRNWKINCRQINSMSGQPKFQEHSILFKSVCTNSRPHDHIAFKTCEETQKKEYCQETFWAMAVWQGKGKSYEVLPKSDWASNLTKCRHRKNRHSASRPVCCYVCWHDRGAHLVQILSFSHQRRKIS